MLKVIKITLRYLQPRQPCLPIHANEILLLTLNANLSTKLFFFIKIILYKNLTLQSDMFTCEPLPEAIKV